MKKMIFNIILIVGLSFILTGCFGAVPKGYTNIQDTKVYCKKDEFNSSERCSHRDSFSYRASTAWVGMYTNDVAINTVNGKKVVTVKWHADNWIFFDKITFKGKDKQLLTLQLKRPQEKMENVAGYPAGSVKEKGDFYLVGNQVKTLSEILKNDIVRVRLSGSKNFYDFTIDKEWKKSLEYMIKFKK